MAEPIDLNKYRRGKTTEEDVDACLDLAAEVAISAGFSLSEFTRMAVKLYQQQERAALREKLHERNKE